MVDFANYFSESDLRNYTAIVQQWQLALSEFSPETLRQGPSFPESETLPHASLLFANRFGISPADNHGVIPTDTIWQWMHGELGIPNAEISGDWENTVDEWANNVNATRKSLFDAGRQAQAWVDRNGPLTLANYLTREWERREAMKAEEARAPESLEATPSPSVPSMCPEGMVFSNGATGNSSYIGGCQTYEPPSLKESDMACGVDGTSGMVVFPDGRQDCPPGMTKLSPNTTDPKRGNSR